MIKSQDKIGVGIIGMGKMGMMHLAILNSIEEVDVVAVCDTSKFFKFIARRLNFQGRIYTSYEKLITDSNIDLIYITTPVFLHYPMIIECIKNKKHFFVEKPLCLNSSETYALESQINRNNLFTMIGYVYNFKPTYSKLKQLVNQKLLGEILSFTSFSFKSSVKCRTNNWRFKPELSGGGVVTSFGSHMLSLISNLFGEVKKIESETKSYFGDKIEDFANIEFTFSSGVTGLYTTDWSKGSYRKEDNRITVICENGELIADNYQVKICDFRSQEEIIPIQELWHGSHLDIGGSHYSIQDFNFVNSILSNKKNYETTCEHGIEVQKIINRIYENKS